MARSNSNGYVPRGIRKNREFRHKHGLVSADRTMTPQYRVVIGPSENQERVARAATLEKFFAPVRSRRLNNETKLSPRQQRKRARLIELANAQQVAWSNGQRIKAAERATVNAARGAMVGQRQAKAEARRAALVEAAVEARTRTDNLGWFAREIEALAASI